MQREIYSDSMSARRYNSRKAAEPSPPPARVEIVSRVTIETLSSSNLYQRSFSGLGSRGVPEAAARAQPM